MSIYNYLKHRILQTYSTRSLSSNNHSQKQVQVCLLGAHTPLGKYTSFLLKQNPIISVLRLQGDKNVKNLAIDLSFIDTKCKVQAYEGVVNVSKAIRSADIVLMLSNKVLKEDTTLADRILAEGKRVYELTKECTVYAPRSIVVVAVAPVSVLTVLVEEVYKQTHWYHPGRIIGSAAIAQVKANTLLGRSQDLDPHICNVPLIGGPDIDLAVPLFSKASPVNIIDNFGKELLRIYRGVPEHEFPKTSGNAHYVENCCMSEAYALQNLISTIGMAICGDEWAYYPAYVRSNLMNTCRHLVTTVRFSRGGVVHNCGLPTLTRLEMDLLEKAALQIKEREQMAKEFLEHTESGRTRPPSFKEREVMQKSLMEEKVVRGKC